MGCSASAAREQQLRDEHKAAEDDAKRLTEQVQDKERQLKEQQEKARQAQATGLQEGPSTADLHSQLQARQAECNAEYQRQHAELEREYEQLQQDALRAQSSSATPGNFSEELGQAVHQPLYPGSQPPTGTQLRSPLSERDYVSKLEAAAARRHSEEAESAEQQLQALREQLIPLQREHFQAADDLLEAREQLRAEKEGHKSSTTMNTSLERRLSESRSEHARAEQRWDDLERHLKEQMKEVRSELHTRRKELRTRDRHLQEREKELAEVNTQLADLQSLFDDVNQQLQTECGRIEQLQETVALCAKQSKELEALQSMLEESHRVLSQMRDALEHERAERTKAAELLDHEQQRTQLLLDVLKHFKQKLQGLTPQMLLGRLGAGGDRDAISKALNLGSAEPASNGPTLRGHRSPVPQQIAENRPKATEWNHEAMSRAFADGGVGAFAGSPRHPGSEGVTSTIAPETSSFAPWAHSAGGNAVLHSAASAVRTPSPAPMRPPASPFTEPLTVLPTRQPTGVPQAFSRGLPDGSHRADALCSQAAASAEAMWQGNMAATPSTTGPTYRSQTEVLAGMPWQGNFAVAPSPAHAYPVRPWDMNGEAAKTLPWEAQRGAMYMDNIARTDQGAYGYAGGSSMM